VTRSETIKLVTVMVSATAQGAKLDEDAIASMVEAYGSLLADLPYERCNAAMHVLLRSQPFMPAVAEIRAAVVELEHGPIRPGGDAWGSVVKAMKCEGSYKTPGVDFSFADPLIARCVAALGWKELCSSEFPVSDRARFIELYDSLARQARREEQVPELAAARVRRDLLAQEERAAQLAVPRSSQSAPASDAVRRVVLSLIPPPKDES
jgi:hypothetical protein